MRLESRLRTCRTAVDDSARRGRSGGEKAGGRGEGENGSIDEQVWSVAIAMFHYESKDGEFETGIVGVADPPRARTDDLEGILPCD